MFKLVVVFLVSAWKVLLAAEQYIVIQRHSTRNNGTTLNIKPDTFVLPPSWCSGGGSQQCQAMGATRIRNCTCECNHANSTGGIFNSATFGFYAGQWKCLGNNKVHEHGGCSVTLNGWTVDDPLITLPNHGVANYEIPTKFPDLHIYKPKSKSQECDGRWADLGYYQDVKKRFSVRDINNKQYLQFNYSGNSSQLITGRVIKIAIGYYSASNYIKHNCLLLKMEGTMQCPFSPPTTAKISTTDTFSSNPPTTVKLILSKTTENITISNRFTPSTDRVWTHTTSVPLTNTRAKSTNSDDRSGLIAGAVAGAIGLVALMIVIILVRKRKKRILKQISYDCEKLRHEHGCDTVKAREGTSNYRKHHGHAEKNDYEKEDNSSRFTDRAQRSVLANQVEYSHAHLNTVPINGIDVACHPRNQDIMYGRMIPVSLSNREDPFYNTLEAPVQAESTNKYKSQAQPSSDVPIYNTLEELQYAKVSKSPNKNHSDQRNEPLYNVLEEPQIDVRATEGLDKSEALCYHVPEGPYSDGGPEYDVLEGPDPNFVCHPNKSGDSNGDTKREYNDILYDSVGGVIPDTGNIYQQLNHNGQREPNVYQALRYPQKMFLTNLNKPHSEA